MLGGAAESFLQQLANFGIEASYVQRCLRDHRAIDKCWAQCHETVKDASALHNANMASKPDMTCFLPVCALLVPLVLAPALPD